MNIALRYAARSDVGLVRANNQDSAYAGPHLLVVADGMGGHAGGDVASSVAVATLAPLDDEAHGPDDALEQLDRALHAAQDELLARASQDPALAGLGTTVTALLRAGSKLAMAHIGDSRAYLLRDGEMAQVTADHTFVQYLVNTGKITAEEAERHPQRSVVMRVLGDFDVEIVPDLSVREARVGDRWLLCSDGLSGVVSADTLGETLRGLADVDECAERLVQLALRAGGPDNITVIVADVVDLDSLPDGAAPGTNSTIVGSAATSRNRPSSAADGPAARAATLTQTVPAQSDEATAAEDDAEDDESRRHRRRRRIAALAGLLVLLTAIVIAGVSAYRWTQTQYYIGVDDGDVAIFRGIPQTVGPLVLSNVVERSTLTSDELPGYVRTRLEQTIPASSLTDAQERVARLAADSAGPTATASPSPSPSPSTTAAVVPVTPAATA
ncbi:MAG: PP2C family protein-serine/threonine phosphatase [Cellulomonas sp.]